MGFLNIIDHSHDDSTAHRRSIILMKMIIVEFLFDLHSDTRLLPGLHHLTLPLTTFILPKID